jgi:hypothetical protein
MQKTVLADGLLLAERFDEPPASSCVSASRGRASRLVGHACQKPERAGKEGRYQKRVDKL